MFALLIYFASVVAKSEVPYQTPPFDLGLHFLKLMVFQCISVLKVSKTPTFILLFVGIISVHIVSLPVVPIDNF